jgi:hypothetical protein
VSADTSAPFPALDASTAAVAQVYFTYREWRLNFRHWAIAVTMTVSGAGGYRC